MKKNIPHLYLLQFIISLIFVIFSFITAFVLGDSFISAVKFLFSQFLTFLCGYCFCKFLKIECENLFVLLFSSYVLGYACAIFFYIVFLCLGIQVYSIIISLVILVFFVLFIFIKRKSSFVFHHNRTDGDCVFLGILFFILLIIGFFGYQCYNMIPRNESITAVHQDLMFWLRNTVAATKSFPLKELSTEGVRFYYHYFSSFYLAYIHFITGIELSNLCFGYSYLINTLLLVGSVYCVCNLFLHNKIYKYVSILIILLTEGIREIVIIYYVHHFYIGSFGFAEGFSLSLFSFYYFIKLYRDKVCNLKLFFVSLLVFAISLGTKAPCTCIVLCSIGIGCFSLFFNKNFWIKGLLAGVSYLIIFALVYFVFIRGINNEIGISTQKMGLSLKNTVLSPGFLKTEYEILLHLFRLKIIAYFICFISWIILSHPLLIFLIIVAFIATRKSSYKFEQILLIVGFISGGMLSVFISHTGYSQMYFYFSAIPFATLFAFERLESVKYNLFKHKFLFICSCILFMFCFSNAFVYLGKYCYCGFKRLVTKSGNSDIVTGCSISKKELDALRWLRDNSNPDSILVTNKIFGYSGHVSFVTSAFSERQLYIEDTAYTAFPQSISKNERLKLVENSFNGDMESIKELKILGVDYMVVYEALPHNSSLNKLNVVYCNSSVTIVKI